MVQNGNSTPTMLEKVLLISTGASNISVFQFRDNEKRLQKYLSLNFS